MKLEIFNLILEKIDMYGESILFSLIAILIGLVLIKFINKAIKKAFEKIDKQDSSSMPIITKFVKCLIYTLIILVILAKFNVSSAAILAVTSSALLTFGIALKDVLSNIAKGIQLLICRPFSTGDIIEVNQTIGKVKKIQLIYTHLSTPDNRLILMPNSMITDNKITNYSKEPIRRLDMNFTIPDDISIKETKQIIYEIILSNNMILNSPPPTIHCKSNDTAPLILVQVWVNAENYENLQYSLSEEITLKLSKTK